MEVKRHCNNVHTVKILKNVGMMKMLVSAVQVYSCQTCHLYKCLYPCHLILEICPEDFVQLKVDLPDDEVESEYNHYLKNGRLSVGRVEVCAGGRYGTICDNYWDYKDASVICSQLQFSPYGSWPTTLYTITGFIMKYPLQVL